MRTKEHQNWLRIYTSLNTDAWPRVLFCTNFKSNSLSLVTIKAETTFSSYDCIVFAFACRTTRVDVIFIPFFTSTDDVRLCFRRHQFHSWLKVAATNNQQPVSALLNISTGFELKNRCVLCAFAGKQVELKVPSNNNNKSHPTNVHNKSTEQWVMND